MRRIPVLDGIEAKDLIEKMNESIRNRKQQKAPVEDKETESMAKTEEKPGNNNAIYTPDESCLTSKPSIPMASDYENTMIIRCRNNLRNIIERGLSKNKSYIRPDIKEVLYKLKYAIPGTTVYGEALRYIGESLKIGGLIDNYTVSMPTYTGGDVTLMLNFKNGFQTFVIGKENDNMSDKELTEEARKRLSMEPDKISAVKNLYYLRIADVDDELENIRKTTEVYIRNAAEKCDSMNELYRFMRDVWSTAQDLKYIKMYDMENNEDTVTSGLYLHNTDKILTISAKVKPSSEEKECMAVSAPDTEPEEKKAMDTGVQLSLEEQNADAQTLNDMICELILKRDTDEADSIRDKYRRLLAVMEKKYQAKKEDNNDDKKEMYFEKLKRTLYDLLSHNETPDVQRLRDTYYHVLGVKRDKEVPVETENKPGTPEEKTEPYIPQSNVNHPSHYNQYEYETITMMSRIWGVEAVKQWCTLTAFKYRMRMGLKDNNSIQQDFEKEQWYLDMARKLQTLIEIKEKTSADHDTDKEETQKGN